MAMDHDPRLTGSPVSPGTKRATRLVDRSERQRPANRHFVEHKYHDHYHDPLPDPSLMDQYDADHCRSVSSSQRGGATLAFPEKLFSMLVASERDGYDDVVGWKVHGRCFIIRKKDVFVSEIMPRFFQQTKLTSFQRQLNLYGFIRLTAGRDRGGYYHEYFIRGRPDLCRFMVRTRVKGNGLKAASSPETEPDFYAMQPCLSNIQGQVRKEDKTKPIPEHQEQTTKKECASSIGHSETTGRKVSFVQGDGSIESSVVQKDPVRSYSAFEMPGFALLRRNPADHTPRVISPPPLILPFQKATTTVGKVDHDPLSVTKHRGPAPSSGDVVYFEGLQFHYLDHMELEEVGEMLAEAV